MEFKKTTIKNKQDFKAFGQKRSKAQHLVEFVLFFPFLVGIIALLSEIGYGINAGIELNSALNRAVGAASSIYRNNNNSSYKDISKEIQDNTRKILASRKVPYSDTVKDCFASARLIKRPAPCGAEKFQSSFPLPSQIKLPSRILMGISNRSPFCAETEPLRKIILSVSM